MTKKKKRTATLRIRVSDDERQAIDHAAATVGVGPCTFARMATIKAAGRKPAPPRRRRPTADAVALAQWTATLAQIGTLLNALAAGRHNGATLSAVDADDIMAELRKLREAVMAEDISEDALP